MKRVIRRLILFFIMVFSLLAGEKGVPNEIIKENPKREVTTVESQKVRDKAKLSLSVTKVTPEELMGKFEDGKLSVFIPIKNKLTKDKTGLENIDIKNIKLKAYSNPKLPEGKKLRSKKDIETFMTKDFSKLKDNVKAKLKENLNKEKNIKVVEKTEEYVKVEVEGVTEKEKIYIAVMNGDKVAKSYRIGTPRARKTQYCWQVFAHNFKQYDQIINYDSRTGISLSGGRVDSGRTIDIIAASPIESNTKIDTVSGMKNARITTDNFKVGKELLTQDAFIQKKVTIGKINDIGFSIYTWPFSPSYTHYFTKVKHKDYLGKGKEPNFKAATLSLNGFDHNNNNKQDYSRTVYSDNVNENTAPRKSSVFYNLSQMYTEITGDGGCTVAPGIIATYVSLIQPVKGFGFEVNIGLAGDVYPGVYKLKKDNENAPDIELQYNAWDNQWQNESHKIGANYTIDVGDVDNYGNPVKKILKMKIPVKNNQYYELPLKKGFELSLMSKTGEPARDGRIWYGDDPFTYNGQNQEVTFEKEINDTNGNGTGYIELRQSNGKFATLYIKTLNPENTPTYKFSLWQGRKINGSPRKLREIDFDITMKISKDMGSIKYKVDNRIGNNKWIRLMDGKSFENNNYSKLNDYPELIEIIENNLGDKVDENRKITDVYSISTDAYLNERNIEGKNYKYKNSELGLPYSIESKKVTVGDYKTGDIFIWTGNPNTNTYFIVDDEKDNFGDGAVAREEDSTQVKNSTGSIDISNFENNVEYSFAPGVQNPTGIQNEQDSGIELTTKSSLDGRGVLSKNNNKNIITKLIVKNPTVQNKSQTIEGIIVGEGKSATTITGVNDKLNNNIAIGVSRTGGLILKKINSMNLQEAGENIIIEYYYQDIKLGEFNLNIKNNSINIGEVKVKIDERLSQIGPSWIKLNGDLESGIGNKVGNYSNFINVEGEFKTFSGTDRVNAIRKLNNQNTSLMANNYYGIRTENEGAFPVNISMEEFSKLDNNSKLYVSKWNVKNETVHNGKNDFLLEAIATNGVSNLYSGKLTEEYIGRDTGSKVVIKDTTNTAYSGIGTLDLTSANVGMIYAFPVAQSDNVSSTPTGITLKMKNGKSLDATGVVTKEKENIANKIKVSVNGQNSIIKTGELKTQILEGKVEVGIDERGQLTVKKLTDENISLTDVVIEYYYDINSNDTIGNNAVKLGTFTLTLKNSITNLGEIEVEIDERLKDLNSTVGQWLFPNGKIRKGITGTDEEDYSPLFKFSSFTLGDTTGETIEKVISMEGRGTDRGGFGNYRVFTPTNADYTDEGATPKSGNMSNFNNMITVSKNNGTNSELLNNRFKLQTTKDNGEKKIYNGNIKEKFVGRAYSGSGTLSIRDVELNKKYIFNKELTNGNSITSTDNSLTITNASKDPVNSFGAVEGKTNQNIANKLKVEFTKKDGSQTVNSKNLEATYDGITVGIDSTTGGMNLEVTSEDTTVTQAVITYYYDPATTSETPSEKAVKLGEFTLAIETLPEPTPVGNITFSVDPRLKQITSTTTGGVSWLTGNGNFGGWDSTARSDYSGFSHVVNNITNQATISDVVSIENKVKSSVENAEYITFSASVGAYNEIAIKRNVALNSLANNDNLMVSPAKEETFATIFKDSNKNRYSSDISLSYVNSIGEDGYTGTGTLDMSNGKKNTPYTFTKDSLIVNNMTMNLVGTFPNTYGVVEGKTTTSVANKFEVAITDTTNYKVTEESGTDGNSLGKWKVQDKNGQKDFLRIELTKSNQLILTKIDDEFDFSQENNQLTLAYKNEKTIGEDKKTITLGTFDLKVKSEKIIKPLTEMNFKIDSRIASIKTGEWISPNGDIFNSNGNKVGSYPELVNAYQGTASKNIGNASNDVMVQRVTQINNSTSLNDNQTLSYSYLFEANNKTALPYNVPINSYNTTVSGTKIVVSKADLNTTKQSRGVITNTFELEDSNEEYWSGSLVEEYLDTKVNNTGTGSIDLTGATVELEYSFAPGVSNPTSNAGITGENTLTLTTDNSLDARGVLNTNNSKNIADKIVVEVNGKVTQTLKNNRIKSDGKKIEPTPIEELNSIVAIGIDSSGGIIIKKLLNKNLAETTINIKYYYSGSGENNLDVELGTFALTLKNTVKELGDITFKVDKRIVSVTSGDWIMADGTLRSTTDEIGEYPYLVEATDSINITDSNEKDKSVLDVIKIMNTSGDKLDTKNGAIAEYKYLAKSTNDIVAFPYTKENKVVTLGQYDVAEKNSLMTISKKDLATTKTIQAKSTFEIKTTDTIYTGSISEEYVGDGAYSGKGSVDLSKAKNGQKYTFQTDLTNGTEISSDSDLKITDAIGTPVKSLGIVGDRNGKNIANKIVVEFAGKDNKTETKYAKIDNVNSGTLEVNYENLTVGIDVATGGLTLQKSDRTKVEKVKISYYYESTPTNGEVTNTSVLLGEFELEVEDSMFEIDGDSVLDFGQMIYRSDYPTETRKEEFKVKNPDGKNIDFEVKSDKGQMNLNTEGGIKAEDKIDLKDIKAQKISNTSFSLQATAVLTPETQSGSYEGEIEVTVTILDETK